MDEKEFKKILLPAFILGLAILGFLIVKPIFIPIVTGLVFGYIFFPLHKKINLRLKKENLTAAIIVCLVALVILIPMLLLLPTFVKQIFQIYLSIKTTDFSALIIKLAPTLATNPQMSTELLSSVSHISAGISNFILSIFQNTIANLPSLLFGTIILLFTFFFSLREGKNVEEYFSTIFPFPKEYREKFYKRFDEVVNSVIYGHIVIGICQGIISGIGFYLFGIPNALFWTALITLAGVIPVVGPWIVWIPLDIFLFATGSYNQGIQLLIFGLFVINWIETLLRQSIVARAAQMNPAIALIGAIGGVYAFGFLGFLLGPLFLACLILLVELYKDKKSEESIVIRETNESKLSQLEKTPEKTEKVLA